MIATKKKGQYRPWNKTYAWDKWFAAGRITLRAGLDYKVSQSSFCNQARNAASRRNLSVRVLDNANSVTLVTRGKYVVSGD